MRLPITPMRDWEGIFEPDEEDLPMYLDRPYSRLVDFDGRDVVWPCDMFVFSGGQAEYLAKAANAYPKLVDLLRDCQYALVQSRRGEQMFDRIEEMLRSQG